MLRTATFQSSTKLRNTNFYKTVLILIIITGIISLSFANNMSEAIIRNTGKIIAEISAQSGSARDIQTAVDQAAALGFGIVRIPEGTFNFVEVGETWSGARVTIPAGVSLFGAPTERDADDQVIEWKTILTMPWDMPSNDEDGIKGFFQITGNSDPNKPSRISDIKLVGYRDINPNSPHMLAGVWINGVINFRVDHCYFRNICAGGVGTEDSSGVIDHCLLINSNGIPDPYSERTVDYGVQVKRHDPTTTWDPIQDILGKYLNYTVFIEDCYFSKWRHCIVGNHGAHYVFRHNIIEYDFAYGPVDAHTAYGSNGNRAVEVYDNQFLEPDPPPGQHIWCIHGFASGSGVIFNNTVVPGYQLFILVDYCEDLYIWNNDVGDAKLIDYNPDVLHENEDFFLHKLDWYTPYLYPHPLTK